MNDKAPDWSFSHVGIFVKDLDAMAGFYQTIFGMVVTDGGEVRGNQAKFLTRDAEEHHQLVLETSRTTDETTVQQISLRFGSLDDLRAMSARLQEHAPDSNAHGVNHGNAWSLYCYDPEGNRIEMFIDSPFHVRQPCREELDLSLSDEEILAATQAAFGEDLTFRAREEWSEELASRL